MKQQIKSAAEYYALGAIDLTQLLDVCETIEEAKEAIDYVDTYYLQYEVEMRRKYKRMEQMAEDWTFYNHKAIQWRREHRYQQQLENDSARYPYYPSKEEWLSDAKTYTDEELQKAFMATNANKDLAIQATAVNMANTSASLEEIYEFLKEQGYTDENQTLFLRTFFCRRDGMRRHYEGISEAYSDNELPF